MTEKNKIIREFKKSFVDSLDFNEYSKIIVHCDTEEKAEKLFRLLHVLGFTWLSSKELVKDDVVKTLWDRNKEETHYYIYPDRVVDGGTNSHGNNINEFDDIIVKYTFSSEFIESVEQNDSLIIHCSEKEEAKALLTFLDEKGYTWASGDSLIENNYIVHKWNFYGNNTVYYLEKGKKLYCGEINDEYYEFKETVSFSDILEYNPVSEILNGKTELGINGRGIETSVPKMTVTIKLCSTCGFDQHSTEYNISCLDFRKKLGACKEEMCGLDYNEWMSNEDVKELLDKYNSSIDYYVIDILLDRFDEDLFIHCLEKEEAIKLLTILEHNGHKWPLPTPISHWEDYGNDTVYRISKDKNLHYGNVQFYDNYDVLKFSDIFTNVKSCDNCGFNDGFSSCSNLRKKLGIYRKGCGYKSEWMSEKVVKLLDDRLSSKEEREERDLKYKKRNCDNCGWATENFPDTNLLSCRSRRNHYLKETTSFCLSDNKYWKSIEDVKNIIMNFQSEIEIETAKKYEENLLKDKWTHMTTFNTSLYDSLLENYCNFKDFRLNTISIPKVNFNYIEKGEKNMENTMTKKLKEAGKNALKINAGKVADKALKEVVKKALPNVDVDGPVGTLCVTLLANFAVDQTRFRYDEKVQYVLEGMFDNMALKGVEATGIVSMAEAFIETTLNKIELPAMLGAKDEPKTEKEAE